MLSGVITVLFPESVQAQVAMKLELNRKNYIQYETVFAKVIMRNDSGHVLAFGQHEKLRGSLHFEITEQSGRKIEKIAKGDPSIIGTILKPGQTKQFIIPVSKYYSLGDPGKYKIIAYIKHAQLRSEYCSNPEQFEVSKGIELWSRTVGVPDFIQSKSKNTIKTRSYTLRTLFDGSDKVIFLVVEDKKMVYAVRKIGLEVSNTEPQCEIDLLSRLHLLLPVSSRIYSYFVFDINGKVEARDVYKRTTTLPMLVRNVESGTVLVAGGERARKKLDYNESDDSPFEPPTEEKE
jgi:hypothetical protein